MNVVTGSVAGSTSISQHSGSTRQRLQDRRLLLLDSGSLSRVKTHYINGRRGAVDVSSIKISIEHNNICLSPSLTWNKLRTAVLQADDSFHLAVEEGNQDIGGYADSELRNVADKKYLTL